MTTALGAALRKKFAKPEEALEVLGLDASLLKQEPKSMKSTRFGALALQTSAAILAPLLAQDAKITLPKDMFTVLTPKNFKEKKADLVKGIGKALEGKLKKGLAMDASMKGLAEAIDAFENLTDGNMDESASEEQHNAMEAAAHGESELGIPAEVGKEFSDADKGKTFDSAPIQEFLRGKGMGEDDIKTVCDMFPTNAMAGDEDDDEAKKKAEEEKKKDEQAMDAKLKGMVSKEDMKLAIDAALKGNTEVVTKQVRENERSIAQARFDVKPWVGELAPSLAFDSAADVHRHALTMLKVDGADKMHADALLAVLKAQPQPGARPAPRHEQHIALDSKSTGYDKAKALAPGLEHIQAV